MSEPWTSEPNESRWITATGYRAIARRHSSLGTWCGYVEVPRAHPLHGVNSSERSDFLSAALRDRLQKPIGETPAFRVLIACALGTPLVATPDTVFTVHGGITFSGSLRGEPDDSWWFGFDCSHSGDFAPFVNYLADGVYRDLAYVFVECESLAAQLEAVA